MNRIFEHLFVLELANNHWGRLERGLRIVNDFSQVVRFNNVRAAIKLQLRNVDSFVHQDFKGTRDVRYISKTEATKLSESDIRTLVARIKEQGCIAMATPFDEASVGFCEDLDLPIIKIASSDINDWFLIERIALTKRPVIVSTGGSSLKDLDDLVKFFTNRHIPLAINHCVSLYPCEDEELELNQVDYLRRRYPNNVIGLSTHEYADWHSSMLISYAKGARTWERHIDIEDDGIAVSPYCSLPHQIDAWFKAYHKAVEMCGGESATKRSPKRKEIEYLDALVRGVYAKRDLPAGYEIHHRNLNRDFYLAIPLLKGQLSCREILNGQQIVAPIGKDKPLMIEDVDSPYSRINELRGKIRSRGL
ncbi:N-acetylneuraminate synthase family protein [uncultured Thiodictyon sp.]|uniref:N-acetylneuraminate synthase family protein n=1 Tax=uncultured Thiodictyon sp. TaxID=1846217 RepID=UPI0025D1FED5|nr:N-acetylneuraminate synthase family protein [uncultured Thiodictyon sp.]